MSQRPGSKNPFPSGPTPERAAYRSVSTRTAIEAGPVAFITPFQGLRTGNRLNVLTQAVGLGLEFLHFEAC